MGRTRDRSTKTKEKPAEKDRVDTYGIGPTDIPGAGWIVVPVDLEGCCSYREPVCVGGGGEHSDEKHCAPGRRSDAGPPSGTDGEEKDTDEDTDRRNLDDPEQHIRHTRRLTSS